MSVNKKLAKGELVAIYRLEFYKNQSQWKFSKNKNKIKKETSSKQKLNETYRVEGEEPAVDPPPPLDDAFLATSDENLKEPPPARRRWSTLLDLKIDRDEEAWLEEEAPERWRPEAEPLRSCEGQPAWDDQVFSSELHPNTPRSRLPVFAGWHANQLADTERNALHNMLLSNKPTVADTLRQHIENLQNVERLHMQCLNQSVGRNMYQNTQPVIKPNISQNLPQTYNHEQDLEPTDVEEQNAQLRPNCEVIFTGISDKNGDLEHKRSAQVGPNFPGLGTLEKTRDIRRDEDYLPNADEQKYNAQIGSSYNFFKNLDVSDKNVDFGSDVRFLQNLEEQKQNTQFVQNFPVLGVSEKIDFGCDVGEFLQNVEEQKYNAKIGSNYTFFKNLDVSDKNVNFGSDVRVLQNVEEQKHDAQFGLNFPVLGVSEKIDFDCDVGEFLQNVEESEMDRVEWGLEGAAAAVAEAEGWLQGPLAHFYLERACWSSSWSESLSSGDSLTFMRGAHARPHSSELDLADSCVCGATARSLANTSSARLARALRRHATVASKLLRELRRRAIQTDTQPRPLRPDASLWSAPTRDVPAPRDVTPARDVITVSRDTAARGRGRGRLFHAK